MWACSVVDERVLESFRAMAADTEIPNQTLINLYLLDCADKQKRLSLRWA